ncbi:FAD-binding oxidoreductase [Halocatena salina]|uniref:FAD-binding oxidoreductase n=2 Tax=Halocatena salina TaxID=2934340 RepID=A0A8U0A4E4_9EURY|nr:FAD-dependent oxidoreductase [Halocatena salina]UPM44081.1 FAD-binding oxidoreductase [Halocatena salina]
MNVAVIGGGAVGVTVAFELTRQGIDVTVYERGLIGDGSASSGRAAGVCYDAYAGAIDATVGKQALTQFREWSREGRIEFTPCPYVWLARSGDTKRAAAIREQVPRMQEHGRNVSFVPASELADRYPALRVDDVAVAAIAENAGYMDPAAYTRSIAAAADRSGATIQTETPATLRSETMIETSTGRESFDAVLVAAGAHTKRVLADADVRIPLKPYRVQALTTESTEIDVPMLFDATGGYYLRPHEEGLFVGDGTEPIERDPDDWDRSADGWFIEAVDSYTETAIGRMLDTNDAWAGLCTATPDGDPLVGERRPGLFVAAGWQGHGFMRAPAIGERIAHQLVGGDGIDAFDPTRFEGNESFEIVEGMDIE